MRLAEAPHGTRQRYLGGCRGVPCRAANSRYSGKRAAAQRAGDYRGLVPTTLVLGHIQELQKAGIGYTAIAAAAGLVPPTMEMLLTGERLQIRKHRADRILAVDRTAVADRALVWGSTDMGAQHNRRFAKHVRVFRETCAVIDEIRRANR